MGAYLEYLTYSLAWLPTAIDYRQAIFDVGRSLKFIKLKIYVALCVYLCYICTLSLSQWNVSQ